MLRQYVANVEVHHAGVRVFGVRSGRGDDGPRASDQVRVLGDDLQLAVAFVGPQRRNDSDGAFLNGPIGRVCRSREAKAHTSETCDAAA